MIRPPALSASPAPGSALRSLCVSALPFSWLFAVPRHSFVLSLEGPLQPCPLLSNSFALFCTAQNAISFLFSKIRTLCAKHRGVGHLFQPSLTRHSSLATSDSVTPTPSVYPEPRGATPLPTMAYAHFPFTPIFEGSPHGVWVIRPAVSYQLSTVDLFSPPHPPPPFFARISIQSTYPPGVSEEYHSKGVIPINHLTRRDTTINDELQR
jgi:hypothetical protein